MPMTSRRSSTSRKGAFVGSASISALMYASRSAPLGRGMLSASRQSMIACASCVALLKSLEQKAEERLDLVLVELD